MSTEDLSDVVLPAETAETARETAEKPSSINALREENLRLEAEVGKIVLRKKTAIVMEESPDYSSYPRQKIVKNILENVCTIINNDLGTNLTSDDIAISKTPKDVDGDITLIFKTYRERGREGITELRTKVLPTLKEQLPLNNPGVKVNIARGMFLNIAFPRTNFTNEVLQSVNSRGESYGDTDSLKGKTYVIDYSSPNIAKLMHVGHLRSTVIGKVIMDILKSQGAVTFGVNHLGDWGTQFGQLAVAYELWGKEVSEEIDSEEHPIEYLAVLYKKIKAAIKEEDGKEQKPLTELGRKKFTDLESGNPEVHKLWEEFRRLSMIDFNALYKRFGSEFDVFLGESFYEDKMEDGVQAAIDQKIATVDENGAVVIRYLNEKDSKINLIKEGESVAQEKDVKAFLLKKSDGGSNYTTRDLAALSTRLDLFKADHVLYVTGNEQKAHFNQFFELSRAIGRTKSDEGIHISFGMVTKGGRKIASREGAGGLGELVDELKYTALTGLTERYPDMNPSEREEAAEILGLGALFYTNFSQKIERNMEFDKDKMLDLKTQSAPYIQYACLRLRKVVEKCNGIDLTADTPPEVIEEFGETENAIIDKLAEFPDILRSVTNRFAPHHLATYLYELSVLSNKLYSEGERVLKLPPQKKDGYAKLYNSIRIVLEKGLKLLNIKVPKIM